MAIKVKVPPGHVVRPLSHSESICAYTHRVCFHRAFLIIPKKPHIIVILCCIFSDWNWHALFLSSSLFKIFLPLQGLPWCPYLIPSLVLLINLLFITIGLIPHQHIKFLFVYPCVKMWLSKICSLLHPQGLELCLVGGSQYVYIIS